MTLWDVFDERQAVRETCSGGQSPIVDNNRHVICRVNFNIKRGWRLLSNCNVSHCPVISKQVLKKE